MAVEEKNLVTIQIRANQQLTKHTDKMKDRQTDKQGPHKLALSRCNITEFCNAIIQL